MAREPHFCPYPFARVALSHKVFVPCCEDWLQNPAALAPEESLWNGASARAFRAAMLSGDLSKCRRDLCQEPLVTASELESDLQREGYYLSAKNIAALKSGSTTMPEGPGFLSIGTRENSCNLKCPSCRDQLITKMSKTRREDFLAQLQLLKMYRADIRVLRLGDNGEVFFSPYLKRILRLATDRLFPQLKEVVLLTNATLLNAAMWERCEPGMSWVREINASIDAASEATYQKIRGGHWKGLRSNLEFIASKRRAGLLSRFYLNMTLQIHNYHELEDFIDLGLELGADAIIIHPYERRSHLSENQYLAHAIHLKEHPHHQAYLQALGRARAYARGKIDFKDKL